MISFSSEPEKEFQLPERENRTTTRGHGRSLRLHPPPSSNRQLSVFLFSVGPAAAHPHAHVLLPVLPLDVILDQALVAAHVHVQVGTTEAISPGRGGVQVGLRTGADDALVAGDPQ